MKKFLVLSLVVVVAQSVFGQALTNAIKISQLTTATTPLAGNEIVPLVQSAVTKQATVAQVIYAATAANVQTSNTLAALIVTATNSIATASNTIIANAAADKNALIATNALLAGAITTTSNGLAGTITTTSNALAGALTSTNAALLAALAASNSIYQVEIAAAAAGVTNAVTNFGTGTFTRLVTTSYTWPNQLQIPITQSNTFIDFTKGSLQRVYCGLATTVSRITFTPTNFVDGDNVYLEVIVTNGTAGNVGTENNLPGNGTLDPWTGSAVSKGSFVDYYSQLAGGTKTAMLNWQVFSNNVVFSMSIHP